MHHISLHHSHLHYEYNTISDLSILPKDIIPVKTQTENSTVDLSTEGMTIRNHVFLGLLCLELHQDVSKHRLLINMSCWLVCQLLNYVLS